MRQTHQLALRSRQNKSDRRHRFRSRQRYTCCSSSPRYSSSAKSASGAEDCSAVMAREVAHDRCYQKRPEHNPSEAATRFEYSGTRPQSPRGTRREKGSAKGLLVTLPIPYDLPQSPLLAALSVSPDCSEGPSERSSRMQKESLSFEGCDNCPGFSALHVIPSHLPHRHRCLAFPSPVSTIRSLSTMGWSGSSSEGIASTR